METISKKLKNLMQIKGGKEKLNEFLEQIKKEFDIIEVKLPEYKLNKINSEYINKTWTNNVNLEKSVMVGSNNKNIVVAFANPEFEFAIINLIVKYELDADYTYLLEDENTGVVVREFFEKGKSMIGEEFESKTFGLKDYNFSMCFQTLYPVTL